MKLTTEKIKQLIREEITHLMNEGTPRNYVGKGEISFNNADIRFFAYSKGSLDTDQIDPHAPTSLAGHYHVKRNPIPTAGNTGALYNTIHNLRHGAQAEPTSEEYVVGIEDRKLVASLKNSNDIE